VILVALVLDRQGPATVPPAAGTTPATLSAAEVARIARRVERIRHLRFERPVKPLFVGRAEAIRLQRQETAREYPPSARAADEESLKLLGLLRPKDSLAQAVEAIEREQVLGFYDNRTKRLVVVRDRKVSRPLLEITLAHELVHALEDQRFGLRVNGGPNDDSAIALSALAEGTATAVMAEYAVRYFGIDDALALFGATSGDQTKLPKYLEDTLLFPYEQGIEFVQSFRDRAGSWKAVDNVIRFRRPATAEQVMHIDRYAVDERPAALNVLPLGPVLGAGWRHLGSSSVGELDLREIFSIVGRSPENAAAAGWNGGRFALWRRGAEGGCAAPCVARDAGVLLLSWDTPADRRAAEVALAAAFPRGLGARKIGRQIEGSAAVRLWSSRGGVIAMRGAGRTTEVIFAPDARTGARILAAVSGPFAA
jgi:hypothetical protein